MLLNDTMPFYRPPFQHFFPLLFSLSLFLSEIFITRRVKIKSDLLFETTHRQTTIHRIEIIPKKKIYICIIFITGRVKIKSDLLFETTETTIHRIEIIPKKKIYICVIFITRRVKIKSDLLFETTHHQTTIHRIEIISKKKTVPFEVFYLFFFLNFLHFSFDSFSFHIQTFIAIQNEQLNNSLEKNPSTSSQREREKGRKEALSSE